jgi:hypothetical protein
MRVERELARLERTQNTYSFIVAAAGEIGNNSFDHNLGNWPDVPGIFFAYDEEKRQIVLADRGQGILKTLKRVKPEIESEREALVVAFTEIISGRAPEGRGNGLKFVRKVAPQVGMALSFQSGDGLIRLSKEEGDIQSEPAENHIHGCLALMSF